MNPEAKHTGTSIEKTSTSAKGDETQLEIKEVRHERGLLPSKKIRARVRETQYREEGKRENMRACPNYIDVKELDKMNHKELQHFVRLHNNRVDLYVTNEYFNWISHLVGAVLFIIATGISAAECSKFGCTTLQTASVIVYCMCITFMQTASALHHGVGLGGVSWPVYYILRIMDYMSIYIAIWGSFLPVLTLVVNFPTNLVMFILTTLLAITGITLKGIFNENLKPIVGIGIYIVMGWDALAFTYFIFKNAGFTCFLLLILMGLSYTVGVIFFATERPIIIRKILQGHEIFHLFVLAGNLIHLFNVTLCMIPRRIKP